MTLTVKQILENKGISAKPEHLNLLDSRLQEMNELRGNLVGIAIDDADIAVRNIPGGDHIE